MAQPEVVAMQTLSGQVLNALSNLPVAATLVFTDLASGEQVAQVVASPDGRYQAQLPEGRQYLVQVQAPGFTAIPAQNLSSEAHYLLPAEGGVVRLHSLRFPFNQSGLPAQSHEELGKLVQFLKRYPLLQIEVGGHADHIGSLEANLRISRQRADQVANYLKNQGIATERMQVKGYGSEKPVENNLTPEQRAQNRRVDFILSEK
jgi:outer membrane protein OmpA-like peptidoglycan-associated protein